MKKAAACCAVLALLVFVAAWDTMGLKLLDNDYLITAEAYIGLVSLLVAFVCILYVKLTDRCPHCQKLRQPFGKYCPHCGKELGR